MNIHDGTAHSLDPKERHEHFVHMITRGHPTDNPPGVTSAPITIEDDVWISFGVSILKGVTIGRGSTVAAGSVVVSDVPANSIYRCRISPVINQIVEGARR